VQQVVRSQTLESIPFKPEHVDVPWVIVNEAGKSHALSMAVSKRAMAQQVELVKSAGFYVQSTYSQITTLVGLCPVKNALMAYINSRYALFVLIADGVPRVTHQVGISTGDRAPHSPAAQTARAVEQVLAYHQTIDLDSKLTDVPLFVTGPMAADTSALKELSDSSGRQVSPVNVQLKTKQKKIKQEFPFNDYVFNYGLAVAHRNRSSSGARIKAGGALDLLPEYQKHRLIPAGALTSFGLLLVAAAFVPQFQDLNRAISADAVELQARIVRLESEERRSRLETARIDRLQSEIAATDMQIQTLESYLDTLSQGLINRMDQLDAVIYLSAPTSVDIINVVESDEGFNVDGSAASAEDLNAYITAVLESGYVKDVKVRSVGAVDAEGAEGLIQASTSRLAFQIVVEVDAGPEQAS
jgi:hypothetical protein